MFTRHLTNHSALRRHGKWGSRRSVGRLQGAGGQEGFLRDELWALQQREHFPGRLPGAGWEPGGLGAPSKSFLVLSPPPRLSTPLGPSSSGSSSTWAWRMPAFLCTHSFMGQGRVSRVLANSTVKPPDLAVTVSGSSASLARWSTFLPVGVEPVSHYSTPLSPTPHSQLVMGQFPFTFCLLGKYLRNL